MPTKILNSVKRHAASSLTIIMFCVAIIIFCLAGWSLFPYSDTVWMASLLSCLAISGLFGVMAALQRKRWALVMAIIDFVLVAGLLSVICYHPAA